MIALVALAAVSTVAVPFDVHGVAFVAGGGLLVQTEGTPFDNEDYLCRFYCADLAKGAPRLIAKGTNYVLGAHGTRLATETGGKVAVFDLPSGKGYTASADGQYLGAFSPDGTMLAMTDQIRTLEVGILNLKTGKMRQLTKWTSGLAKFGPAGVKPYSHLVLDWDEHGLWMSTDYESKGFNNGSPKFVSTYVDPMRDRITGKAPAGNPNWPTGFDLPDGSRVVDLAADDKNAEIGDNRIARVAKGKATVLWKNPLSVSAGHEMGAGFLARGKTVIVYGAIEGGEDQVNGDTAYIWSIDPRTGKTTVIASGPYKMPKWADGNSMFVDLNSDGTRIAYADFSNPRIVHVEKVTAIQSH